MKIGIDVSQIVFGGGVSVYTQNLVNAFLELDKENEYVLFFSSLRQKIPRGVFVSTPKMAIKKLRIPPVLLDILWNRLHLFPVEWWLGKVDVFHSSDWTQPPARKASLVTTIHDLSFLRWPESVHPRVLAVQRRRLKWVKKEKVKIIAVSQATKKEIVELLDIPEERITVIYEGVPGDVERFAVSRQRRKIQEQVKKEVGLAKPYFLAYGSSAPRKNIARLIEGFLERKELRKNYLLVITGNWLPEKKMPPEIVFPGFLPREKMLGIFSGAEALVYPSLYEGFGLPILEAFRLGVPVITSNCSAMKEVAGKAAFLVNPLSSFEIGMAMEKVAKDSKQQSRMRREGKKRLKFFSWKKAARETLRVYQQR